MGAGDRALTETGRITDEHRQELILWSDALGLSMLVDALELVLEHELPDGATESTVLGPFYLAGAPMLEYGASISKEAAGVPAYWAAAELDAVDDAVAAAAGAVVVPHAVDEPAGERDRAGLRQVLAAGVGLGAEGDDVDEHRLAAGRGTARLGEGEARRLSTLKLPG